MTEAPSRAAVGEAGEASAREDQERADAAPDKQQAITPELLEHMTLFTARAVLEAVIGPFEAHPALTDVADGRMRVTSGQLTEEERMALQVDPMHSRRVESIFGQLGHVVGRTNQQHRHAQQHPPRARAGAYAHQRVPRRHAGGTRLRSV